MSEADTESRTGREEVWIEKYRPESLGEVMGHEDIVGRLQSYVDRNDLSHFLFSGPAGTGKCVTGETPILTDQGLAPAEEIVGDSEGFETPRDGLEVLTFDSSGAFEYVEPSHVFGKETDETVTVETRDGSEMTVTPEHRLLVADEDGLDWRSAENLNAGDRVVRPLEAPLPAEDREIDWTTELDGEWTHVHLTAEFASEHGIPVEERFVGTRREVVRALREIGDIDQIVDEHGFDRKYVQSIVREELPLEEVSTVCRLSYLRGLGVERETLREHVRGIQRVAPSNNVRSDVVTPAWEMTPTLARFVALAISEARIDGGRIKFYNESERLREQFVEGATEIFGAEPTTGTQQGVPYVEIRNGAVTMFLRSCFDVFASATGAGSAIGAQILRADEESRAAFLRAMFDAEGYVSKKGIIELTQKNGDHITLLSYLLSSFGIPSRRKKDLKRATNGTSDAKEYHSLYISGARHLERFADRVGFGLPEKCGRLQEHASKQESPNHDTMPVQEAVNELCDQLYLQKSEHVPSTLNPESPGRESYNGCLSSLRAAANKRLEAAQDVRQTVATLDRELAAATQFPLVWEQNREALTDGTMQASTVTETGISRNRIQEYATGERNPYVGRTTKVCSRIESVDTVPEIAEIQSTLREAVEELGVPFARLAEGTAHLGTDLQNLLTNDDHSLRSLPRFRTLADRLDEMASEMLSEHVLGNLAALKRLVDADLYFDEVQRVERTTGTRDVYDFTVPGSRNYVAGTVPTVMHNTTSATAIARELYGDDWRENFLELNASDERGIDVVRDRIKNFARTSFGGYNYRIIFLDEADALCVPPGTEVVTGYPSSPEVKPIENVAEDGEPIPSVDFDTNGIQSDKGKLVDSGIADFFEVELADGRTIQASLSHPFFVVGEDGKLVEKELQELAPGDEIADFKTDIGVSRCEVCGDWTAGSFCSLECKNEGHSRRMQGEGNPMHGTEWSEERREKIVEKLSDGRFAGENNPNHGGEFHGVSVWDMDETAIKKFREKLSERRSGTSWEEWVVDADAEEVKRDIGSACAEWWENVDDDERERIIEKATENCDYPVCDISGDNNPMRDPEVAQKLSEALQGHAPTGGNIRHSDELGHLVRSDWEYEVAKALQDAGVEYQYEPEFELSDSVFHPDFIIGDTVIEVKGSAKLWGQVEKVEEFLETYGDEYRFVVVGDEELPHHEHYDREEFQPALVSDGGLQTVETVEVRSIEYSHRGKAYNISMEGTPNFMLANGILTHNTADAQSALRRTMEQFSNNVRFILSCNYSSQIIDPIQSRCAVFRFSPLSDNAVEQEIRHIAAEEGIELTDDGLDALVYAAGGDMRKAINGLQAASVSGDVVDESAVYAITSTARPEEIHGMVQSALDGDFTAARATLDRLLTEEGIAGGDIIDQLHRTIWEFDVDDRAAVRILERVGETDYRITQGANERVQLEAMLASLANPESV